MSRETDRQKYARLAGFAFLFYIAAGLWESSIFARAVSGSTVSAKLASIVLHETEMRMSVILTLATVLSALVLAVALFMVTCTHDLGLALVGLAGRIAEGVLGAIYALPAMGLLSLARGVEGNPAAPEAAVIAGMMLDARHQTMMLSAVCFAAGSTAYSFILLRGRAVPAGLAWFGLIASGLLLVALPAQLAMNERGILSMLVWLPMLLFEIVLGLWLILRGVAPDRIRAARAVSEPRIP